MWSWLPSFYCPYMLRGVVAAGRHEGSDMGFPTANIQVPDGIQVPADGVYEGLVLVDDTGLLPLTSACRRPMPTMPPRRISRPTRSAARATCMALLCRWRLRAGCVRLAYLIPWTS